MEAERIRQNTPEYQEEANRRMNQKIERIRRQLFGGDPVPGPAEMSAQPPGETAGEVANSTPENPAKSGDSSQFKGLANGQ